MSLGWLEHKERSYAWVLKLMLWFAMTFGRSLSRLWLYPITLYYLFFSRITKKASRNFLGRVLSKKINYFDIYRHYHYFASVFLDRVFILNDGGKDLEVNVFGKSVLSEIQGKGCLLFGSHLGSFEIVRAYGLSNLGFSPKILMNDSSTENANTILNNLNPEIAKSIIQIGNPHSLLQVKEIVGEGQMVALLADRVFQNEKSVSCDFLGQKACFPSGPATLGGILKVPVVLFFGIYKGGNRYDIYFEKLADNIQLEGKDDEKSKQEWMQRYADRLEHYSRKAPFNWFNFFDYWGKF
jgi:predicted LPLAT superfamily acyltransferase